MSRILFLSNGHGEDLSGSLLASEIAKNGNSVDALPLVGKGESYETVGISIIGKTRNFATGGLGYNSLKGRIHDLFNGQIIYILKKFILTLRIRKKYDYLIVVGDILPIIFAWFSGKKFFVYLVAYSSHYDGKLKLPWPCNFLLKSKMLKRIYSRDFLTSYDLTKQLQRKVIFYGNPFMDKLFLLQANSEASEFNILLLPGSRFPELKNNFDLMLKVLKSLSQYKYFKNINFNFVLVNSFVKQEALKILEKNEWQVISQNEFSNSVQLKFRDITLQISWNNFENLLNKSDLVISMSGTATEQAVGLSKPVIQIEGSGPQFTKNFAEAQRRLLGNSIFCAIGYNTKKQKIDQTVSLILKIIYRIKIDQRFLLACKENAKKRLGEEGACIKIVTDINLFLDD